MLAVLRFEASEQDATFVDEAVVALRLLAARPGFRWGQLVRAYDQPGPAARSAVPSREHRGEPASGREREERAPASPAIASNRDEDRIEGAVNLWCLVTEWESVGAYRRAVGSYDVRSVATPLLSRALSEPSAFEALATAEPGEDGPTVRMRDSDRSIGSRT